MAVFVESLFLPGLNSGYRSGKDEALYQTFSSLDLLTTDGREINQSFYANHKLTVVIGFNDNVDPSFIIDDYVVNGLKDFSERIGDIIVVGDEKYMSVFDGVDVAYVSRNREELFHVLGIDGGAIATKIMVVHESGDIIKNMTFDGFSADIIWHEIIMMLKILLF